MATTHFENPQDEIDSDSQPTCQHKLAEGLRLFFSTVIVTLLTIVVFVGIANQWCVLALPPIALYLILFFCLIILAYVESLHYACKSSTHAKIQ
jgi:hypothetical protein